MNVADLVHGVRLTPTQRRIARSLVDQGAHAAHLTASEVAELAQVSQPSVTRFAMALGYDGYPALRRRLRELTADSADAVEPAANDLQLAVRGEIANLTRLADQLLDPSPITQAAQVLTGSRPLPVLGLRAAAPIASYFGYFAAKIHPDVRALTEGGSLLADRLEQAKEAGATALLAVVLPRYPRESVEALRFARDLGLTTVVITDSKLSPVGEVADLTLPAAVGSDLVFDLHTAPMVLTMVVLQAMTDADPAQTQRRLEEFETTAARRGVFVD
ncbi:DNA-binding MurR/RpiR family transcriptional regulator [Hamadaea flava]|uniref:MurR/RpiR family transcriptional regulator n=1 Tax=Hamadaea flava TaxID=1742688 RepID=A0ABV8M3P4_9ACTN|nr:MurR/RpiR family transcriptional regulator [Hamadaea flava]MCP2326870.1 DNA-binding MurR/RpiR family transcriptional regulator [Hamadaea flava]